MKMIDKNFLEARNNYFKEKELELNRLAKELSLIIDELQKNGIFIVDDYDNDLILNEFIVDNSGHYLRACSIDNNITNVD